MPSKSNDTTRNQWIAAIKKYQNYDENRKDFNVCWRHFTDSDLFLRGNQKILRMNAIPSIFNAANNTFLDADSNIESNGQNDDENVSVLLQARVAELEKEIAVMKIQHDIELQKMKIKSTKLHDSQTNKLKEVKKELCRQKTKVLRLEDVIKDLHEERYISSDDAKFLSVSSSIRLI